MIDSNFIIAYTNALYSTEPEFAPTYKEFRDMFSSGQIWSKEWVLRELANIDPVHRGKTFAIAGAWYGTLGMMIKSRFPSTHVTMIDIDPRCGKFIHSMIYNNPTMKSVTDDMYTYNYTEDVVVNTSCEHIPDIKQWLSRLPQGTTVILQSNNFEEAYGHINCVDSIDDFILQTELTEVIYSGELKMPMYTRYMIIGTI